MCESEGKDNLQVSVRVRPCERGEKFINCNADGSLKIDDRSFYFDHAFDAEATQELVFAKVAKRIVTGCAEGYNGTIFAYGQTGSGKTYSMVGPEPKDKEDIDDSVRGIIPRSLEYLFMLIDKQVQLRGAASVEFQCRCSFVEIYCEQIYDLLDPGAAGLQLREDLKNGVYVSNVDQRVIANASEALCVLQEGWTNRKTAATAMNRESSRSHAVFTIYIQSKMTTDSVTNIKESKLNLVDLAGSERQKAARTEGVRLKEANHINNSLLTLGMVMNTLVKNGQRAVEDAIYVSYRDAKLTFLLKSETLTTLRFAQNAKMVRNRAIINEDVLGGDVAALKAQVSRLTAKLNSRPSIGGPNDDKQSYVEEVIRRYLYVDKQRMACIEQMSDLRQVRAKKDERINCLQMVIKFREKRIDELNQALNKAGIDEELTQAIQASMVEEMQFLKKQLEDNAELKNLKKELALKKKEGEIVAMLKAEMSNISGLNRAQLMKAFEEHCPSPQKDEKQLATIQELETKLAQAEKVSEEQKMHVKRVEEDMKNLEEERKRQIEQYERYIETKNLRVERLKEINDSVLNKLSPPAAKATTSRKDRRRTMFTPGTGTSEVAHSAFGTPRRSVVPPMKLNLDMEICVDQIDVVDLKNVQNECQILEIDNDKLQQRCMSLEGQVNRMRQIVNEREEVGRQNEAQLAETLTKLQRISAEKDETLEFLAELTFKYESMLENSNHMEIVIAGHDETVMKLRRRVDKIAKERDEHLHELTRVQQQEEILNSQSNEDTERIQQLQQKLQELETAECESNSKAQNVNENERNEVIVELKEKLAYVTQKVDDLKGAVKTHSDKENEYRMKLKKMNGELENTKCMIESANERAENCNSLNEKLERKIQCLCSQKEETEKKIQTQIAQFQIQEQQAKKESEIKNGQLAKCKKELEEARKRGKELCEEIEILENRAKPEEMANIEEIDKLRQLCQKFEDNLGLRDSKIAELNEIVRITKAECEKSCNEQLDKMRLENKKLATKITHINKTSVDCELCYEKEKQREIQAKKIGELKEQCIRFSNMEEKIFDEKDRLCSELRVKEEEKNRLKERLRKVQIEFEDAIAKNSELVGHKNKKQKIQYVEDLKNKIIALEQELNETKNTAKCASIKKRLRSQCKENNSDENTPCHSK